MWDLGAVIEDGDLFLDAGYGKLMFARAVSICVLPEAMEGVEEFAEGRDGRAEIP